MEEYNVIVSTIYQKAIQLLNESNTFSLSIIDEDGYPKIYPMEKVVSVNLDRVIFITKKNSNKVRFLNLNNKCCVEVNTEDDMVCLRGCIEIQDSEEEKRKVLPADYIKRLEESGSNKYCILVFQAYYADLYMEGNLQSILIK